jgi:ClpP class serine protease
VHVNQAKALEAQGVEVTLVSAGEYKTEGSEFAPLSTEGRAEMQRMVDKTYSKFVASVARNRGVAAAKVKSDYGKGRIVPADEALSAGMIDKVVTFEGLMQKLTGTSGANSPSRMAALEMMRLSHAQAKRKAALLGLAKSR